MKIPCECGIEPPGPLSDGVTVNYDNIKIFCVKGILNKTSQWRGKRDELKSRNTSIAYVGWV